jgi:hypothetical protein
VRSRIEGPSWQSIWPSLRSWWWPDPHTSLERATRRGVRNVPGTLQGHDADASNGGAMPRLALSADVLDMFGNSRTCESTTLGKNDIPTTWPPLPFGQAAKGTLLSSTSVGLPHKAYDIRRNPRVAQCPDQLEQDFDEYVRRAFERETFSRHYGADPISRRAFAPAGSAAPGRCPAPACP